MKLILTILTIVTLNNVALFAHYKHADNVYAQCYEDPDNSYEENGLQTCMKKDTTFRILGTILFAEGSDLEEVL
jgi:hypothetical protein